MRVFVALALTLSFCAANLPVISLADDGYVSNYDRSAPADEYFGHAHESVLGIRNRPDTVVGLDNLQDSILAWQRRFPADPWLPHCMARLVHSYARAGQASDPRASAILSIMLAQYKNSPDTHDAMMAISNEPPVVDDAPPAYYPVQAQAPVQDDAPVDTSAPVAQDAPVYAAPAPVYQPPSYAPSVAGSIDIGNTSAWSAFVSFRSAPQAQPQVPIAYAQPSYQQAAAYQQPVAEAPAQFTPTSDEATLAGEVVDGNTGAPVAGAVVFVATGHDSNDVAMTPFATTDRNGAFSVQHVPLGAEHIVVQPPSGSGYASYHGVVVASDANAQAGTIRLNTL
jgi:hypothetical protein